MLWSQYNPRGARNRRCATRSRRFMRTPQDDENPDAQSLGVWWRWSRVELSLRQQLVVWVVPDWNVTRDLLAARMAPVAA